MEEVEDKKSLIENLEVEKLRLEIKNLKRSNWKKPQVVIPIVIVLVTYLFNREYINAKIDLDTVKLERGNIQLEDDQKELLADKDSLDQIIDSKESKLLTLSESFNVISDSLKISRTSLKLSEGYRQDSERKRSQLVKDRKLLENKIHYEIKSRRFEELYRLSLELSSMIGAYEQYRVMLIKQAKDHNYTEEDESNIELVRSQIDPKMMNSWQSRIRVMWALSSRFNVGFNEYPFDDSVSAFQLTLEDIWSRNKDEFEILDAIMSPFHKYYGVDEKSIIKELESISFYKGEVNFFFNKEVDQNSLEIVTIESKK